MINRKRVTIFALLCIGLIPFAHAELIPTPDFSNHEIPSTVVPSAESAWWAILDIAALTFALCLATYFAHVTRSRRHLTLLTLASLVWFGFVRGGCVCAIGAIQNVALATFHPSYVVPITAVVFFTLPLVITLFFGRTFCAAVCPLGAIQELVSVRIVRVPTWLDQSAGLLPYVYLGAAVLLAGTNTAFVICRFDPFVGFFRLSGSAPMLLFGGSLLLLGVFVGRPYCRYLCPYGAILRLLSRFSKWHVRITPASCVHCRLCEDVCPYGAIHAPTPSLVPGDRSSSKRRFVITAGLAPIIVIALAYLGIFLSEPLSRWHPEVQLAEQLRQEELGLVQEPSDATDAFRSAGGSPSDAYSIAVEWQNRYRRLGTWLGAWVGLVVAAKLIQLSLRRKRIEYQADHAACVSCGRCYWYCPVEQVRLGLITDISEVAPEVTQ